MWEYFRVVGRKLATPPYATPPYGTKCEGFENSRVQNPARDRKYEIILDRYLHREFAMRSSTRLAEDAEDPEHRSLTEKEGSSAAIDTLADRWCKVSSKGACG
jgi:hypothetical protein